MAPRPANTFLRLSAGATDALVPYMLVAVAPVHVWVAPGLRLTADEGFVQAWSLCLWAGYYSLYSVLSHLRWGKTLSKWVFRLSVVHMDGSGCSRSTILRRELYRGGSLAALSIPPVLWLPLHETSPGLVGLAGAGGLQLLYTVFVAPVVAVVVLCPILSNKRVLHDQAAESGVIAVTKEATPSSPYPTKNAQGAVIFFMGMPVLFVAVAVSPNILVFLGILLASVFGFAVVRALYERIQR